MPHKDPIKFAEYHKAYRQKQRESGACLYGKCRLPAAPGKRQCVEHLAMTSKNVRARQLANVSAGLCVTCAAQTGTTKVSCEECLSRLKEKRVRLLADGLCTICGATATAREFCEEHWFRQMTIRHKLGGMRSVSMLRRIWERQGGRCALTGDILIPGHNASLDHVVATARGGKGTEENLQWVTRIANWMKRDMTMADFVSQCRAVVAHADAKQAAHEEELH